MRWYASCSANLACSAWISASFHSSVAIPASPPASSKRSRATCSSLTLFSPTVSLEERHASYFSRAFVTSLHFCSSTCSAVAASRRAFFVACSAFESAASDVTGWAGRGRGGSRRGRGETQMNRKTIGAGRDRAVWDGIEMG